MKKILPIMLVALALSVYTAFFCWFETKPKVWQQIKSDADLSISSDVEYALNFTVLSSAKKFESGKRPKALSARMIEIGNPKNKFLNDSPHRGYSDYIGMWATGYNSDGDLVVTARTNPTHFREVYDVPEENDVLVEVILSADGFHDLYLTHVFTGKSDS